MPIAIKSTSSAPNTTVTFDFADSVLQYVVGVSYWKFSFGSDDHHVRKLALAIDSNLPRSNQVTATVTATLNDDSGHGVVDKESLVGICCIAVVRASDGNILLTDVSGIKSESTSGGLSLPSSALSIGSAFLSGHSLTQLHDHHVMRFQTTAGFRQLGSQGQVTSQADMCDASGNVSDGYINAGLVAASTSEKGILSRAVINQQTGSGLDVDFGVPLAADAAVMLQSLVVAFSGNDHHVQTIGGGCSGWRVKDSKVTLNDARAFLTDDTHHLQDNGESRVSLVVFALPSGQQSA